MCLRAALPASLCRYANAEDFFFRTIHLGTECWMYVASRRAQSAHQYARQGKWDVASARIMQVRCGSAPRHLCASPATSWSAAGHCACAELSIWTPQNVTWKAVDEGAPCCAVCASVSQAARVLRYLGEHVLSLTRMNLRDYLELKVQLEGTSGAGSSLVSVGQVGRAHGAPAGAPAA